MNMLKSSGLKIPGRGPKHSSPVGRTSAGGTSSPGIPKDSKSLPPSEPTGKKLHSGLLISGSGLRLFVLVSQESTAVFDYTLTEAGKCFLRLDLTVCLQKSPVLRFIFSCERFGEVPRSLFLHRRRMSSCPRTFVRC